MSTTATRDTIFILNDWIQENWVEDPYSTVEHYLIPPKSQITFGRRFDLTSTTDTHIHVRNIHESPEFIDTAAKLQDNYDIVNLYVEVRYIPEAPLYSPTEPAPPSRMMWHIRSYIDELIRRDPWQLEDKGIEVISMIQQVADANTHPDVHGQSAIEQLYTIVFTLLCFYTLEIPRVT